MKDLTLEKLQAGQQLKASLAKCVRLFGNTNTWGIVDACLDAPDQVDFDLLERNQKNVGDYDTN